MYHQSPLPWAPNTVGIIIASLLVVASCTHLNSVAVPAQAANSHVSDAIKAMHNANRPSSKRAAKERRQQEHDATRTLAGASVQSAAPSHTKKCTDKTSTIAATRRALRVIGKRNQMELKRTFDTAAAVRAEAFETVDYDSEDYLNDDSFMWQFIPYRVTDTTNIRSYIPPFWVKGLDNYTGRYTYEAFDDELYDFPEPSRIHELYLSLPRGADTVDTQAHVYFQLGLQRHYDTETNVYLNGNDAATTFIDSTGNSSKEISVSYDGCGAILTINTTSAFHAKPVAGSLSTSLEPISVIVGTETPTTCGSEYSAKIWVGGGKDGKAGFATSGFVSNVYFDSDIDTLDYDYNQAETLILNNAVWQNEKGKLQADGTNIVVHRIFQPYNLIGSSTLNTTRYTKLDTKQGALHTYAIDGPTVGAATISPSTSKTVMCDLGEMSFYEVERIPFTGPSSTTEPSYGTTYDCYQYYSVEDATEACNIDDDCIGFVTMQMQAYSFGSVDNGEYDYGSDFGSYDPSFSFGSDSSLSFGSSSGSTSIASSSGSSVADPSAGPNSFGSGSFNSDSFGSGSFNSDSFGSGSFSSNSFDDSFYDSYAYEDWFDASYGDSYYDYSVEYDDSQLTYPTELPYCMLKTGEDTIYGSRYPRAFYKKPTSANLPTCTIPVVSLSGTIDVFIQQSGMANGEVGVVVNGELAKVCGAENPFANGFAGEDGECQKFALCYSGPISAGSSIEVIPLSVLSMNRCASSLAVLVNMSTVDDTTVSYVAPASPIEINTTGFTSRSVSTPGSSVRVYVGHADRAALSLVQGAFNCVGRSCPDYQVQMTANKSCQRCGGVSNFLGDQIGLSDRCQRSQYCGLSMQLDAGSAAGQDCVANGAATSQDTPYSGFMSIAFNTASMSAKSESCDIPAGTLYVSASNSSSGLTFLPVFPFLNGNDGTLRPLIAIPARNTSTNIRHSDAYIVSEVARVTSNYAVNKTAFLTEINVFGNPYSAYYVALPLNAQGTLLPNISIACLLDHSGGKGVTCEIPVPKGATFVDVKVSQSAFAESTITIQGMTKGQSDFINVCGGSTQFGKFPAASDRCNLFLSCTKRYLFSNDTTAAANTNTIIRVTFPSNVETTCDLEAAVIATFSATTNAANGTCEADMFQCGNGERKCIPYANVCDYIQDCEDGSDESACLNWKSLSELGFSTMISNSEGDFKTTIYNNTAYPGVNTFAGCRLRAAIARTVAFTITQTTCVIFARTEVLKALKSISNFLEISENGEQTYTQVQADGGDSMDMCLSGVHCNGNGYVVYGDDDTNFAKPPCTCECNSDYYGTRCADSASLGATGKLEFGFIVSGPEETGEISITSFRSSLLEFLDAATVVCEGRVVMVDTTHAAIRCLISATSGSSDASTALNNLALSDETIASINEILEDSFFHIPVAYAIPTTVVATEVACKATAASPCLFDVSGDSIDSNTTGNASISKSGRSKQAKAVLFEVADDAFASVITITLEGSSSTSSSRVNRREITCTPSVTSSSGCKVSTCVLNQTDLQGMKKAYISNVTLTGVQSSAYDQCSNKQRSARVIQEGVSSLSASSYNPESEVTDYQAFLIVGILIIAAGCGFTCILSVVFCCCHYSALNPYEERSRTEESKLRAMELKILCHLQYYEIEPDNRAWDNHAIRAGLAFAVLMIVGVFMILFFFTSYDRDSNYAPLVEEYPDSNCDNSVFAFVPKRSFYINKNNTICKQQEVTGSSIESIFAKGRCEGTTVDNVKAYLQAGTSLGLCRSATESIWSNSDCRPVQSLLPSVTRSTYIKVRCAEADYVENRVQSLGLVAGNSSLSESTTVSAVSDNLKISHFGADGAISGSPGDKVYKFPYLQGQIVRTSSSRHPVRVASHGDMTEFDGNADGFRLVGQNADSYATTAGSSTIAAEFDDVYESTMDRLTRSELSKWIPTDITNVGDQPVGYVLNGFTETDAGTTGTDASKNALRYYGIRRTPFDIGAYFPQNVDLKDGMGMTISMYVRARSTTRGFIFAITDVVENAVTNENYLLTKLWDMIINAQPASRWYTNTSYAVYSSLFLNGPSSTLTFAYVDSSLPDKLHHSASEREGLVTMSWDLETLGLTRLLNGDWHSVSVALRVENEKLKATLSVDGQTSYSAEGWSNCVPRFPSPISEITLGSTMPTKNSAQDVVKPGGELMVGFMNGGVYGLTVRTTVISPDNLLLEDTQAARNFDDFPRDDLMILAGVLFCFGLLGVVVVIVVTVPEVAKTEAEQTKAKYRSAAVTFYATTLPLTNFSIEDAAKGPRTPRGQSDAPKKDETAFDAIRFNTALRLTGCTVGAFQSLLDDVANQSATPGLAILTVIYHGYSSVPDFRIKEPVTVEQWNTMVRADEKDQLEQDAKRCCAKKSDVADDGEILTREAQEDIEYCSGNVFYQGGEFLKGIMMSMNHEGVEGGGAGEGLGEGISFEGGGGTQNMQMGSAGGSGTMASSFLDLFAPVIVVFQSAFVWITSIGLPGDYEDMFGNFFSFLSVDFVNAFPNLPTLLTPLMQLFAGLILLSLLTYLLLQDRRTFDFNLMRYINRRDTLEGSKAEIALAKEKLGDDIDAIDERTIPLPEFNLSTLSHADCRKVDYFAKIVKVPDDLQDQFGTLPDDESTKVKLPSGSTLTITRGEGKGEVVYDQENNKTLTTIPVMCQLHPSRRLCPSIQTKVYPYSHPSTCAVVVNGSRCGKASGTMFTCGYHDPLVDGTTSVCTYGICQDHMILKPVNLAKAHAVGTLRMLKDRGFWWVLTAILLTVAHALYTPVLKTAMMVASCHPFYQCEFKQCWSDPNQKFIIAAFLALTLIVLFGIGVPLIELIVLLSRGRKLGLAFHGEEYEGRYEEEEKSTTALIYKKITGKPLMQVKYLEWSRFLETDLSRMAVTYKVVKFSALFVPPLLIAYKVAVVAPAVLLEAGSLDQRIAISAVEMIFATCMFVTNAFITPFVTLTFRVASIHQLLILGMSAASAVYKYDTGKDLSAAVIAITFVYIVFNAVVLILTVIWPVLTVILANRRAKKLVTEHGYEYSQGMSLWVDPIALDAEKKSLTEALEAPTDFGTKKTIPTALTLTSPKQVTGDFDSDNENNTSSPGKNSVTVFTENNNSNVHSTPKARNSPRATVDDDYSDKYPQSDNDNDGAMSGGAAADSIHRIDEEEEMERLNTSNKNSNPQDDMV